MSIKIGHASLSEKGTISGVAGDQTGKEVCTRKWYKHSKGWVTLRCKVGGMAEYIAEAMEKACANDDIGYDQYQNGTLWENIKTKGYDPAKTTKKVETDCARLVRVCVQYAVEKMGLDLVVPDFYTGSEASTLVKTGLFEKLTDSKYNTQDKYLRRGDIQVTKMKGHTWIILENGDKVQEDAPAKVYALGERLLKNGREGEDVKELQVLLLQLDYDLGKWGADGEFGDATELAVRAFQTDHDLEVDGVVGEKTLAALMAADDDTEIENARYVKIVGGNCYIRAAPNTNALILGVAHKGETYSYQGETINGWPMVIFDGKNAFVNGKYAKRTGD